MPIVIKAKQIDEAKVAKTDLPVQPKTVIHVDDDDLIKDGPANSDEEQTYPLYRQFNRDPRITPECLEVVSIDAIKPDPKQAKKHPEKQIAELARSIEEFGFNDPIEVDEDYNIISGHGRYLAAKRLGMKEIQVIRYSHLSAAKKRAYAIAANKIAEHSEWDNAILAEDFELFLGADIDIDPRSTGFETVEIDRILFDANSGTAVDPADQIEEIDGAQHPVTKPGDMWLLDQHVLLCGDALQHDSYGRLLGLERARIVFTDSPYNVPNKGHVTKRAGVAEFAMAHGEMSPPQFIEFQETVCANILAFLEPGAVVYMCIDHRHLLELRIAGDRVFGPHKTMIAWIKPNAGMGSFYRSQYELIVVYAAAGRVTNNFGLGGNGRHRSNVWHYPGLSSFGRDRDETLAMHPTVKPVAMVDDALKDCSNRGDIVLDPFGGSGTTLIAAERTGRKARLLEIDPLYCDLIVRRWQTMTGKTARLADGNETFDEIEDRRGAGQ